jgi:uncharacterized protein (DUF4415 family)
MRKARRYAGPMPTDEEEAAIQRGIALDPDNPEWTEEDFAKAKPFAEMFPALAESYRRTRGPQKTPTKQLVSLRLDGEVISYFKEGGPGWQTRINETLRRAIKRRTSKQRA